MMSDLRQRVPGHSLIDELLHQWDIGAIHLGTDPDEVVVDDKAVSWYRGVIGERRIADLLDQLGEGWTVLHSVPVGSGNTDIDHVVIGPTGVFTINTKYSPGKDVWVAGTNLRVGGHAQRFVHNSIREAIRGASALSRVAGFQVRVTGVIVFVDPQRLTVREVAGDADHQIRVISDRELPAAFDGPITLTENMLHRVVDAAVRPDTWHIHPSASTIGGYIEREFAALEEAVGPSLAAPIVRPQKPRSGQRPQRRRTRTGSSRSPSRRRGRRSSSTVQTVFGLGVLAVLGYLISRPDGQALLNSLFGH